MATHFTDKQIQEILNIFRQNLGHRQYIGARYVPIFGRKGEDSIEWDNTKPYEPLTIVLHQGNSFTSRQYVPAGIDIDNNDFWAKTGNFNAQIEQYRQEVLNFDGRINALDDEIEDINKYTSKRKSKVLAHRGTSTISSWVYAIDNSIWSYIGAFANGFDGFECDVRMDVNGAYVMLHDATTDGVSLQTGNIAELDYTRVFYKTKKTNVQTPTHLTSFVEMCQIVKQFDGFAFVEIKDENIVPSEINEVAQNAGLSYENYAFYPSETLSNPDAWFETALDIPYMKIGYFTDDYTATSQEMAALKTLADAHGKPYDEIIVRCNHPQDIANIKNAGFLCSYDPTSTFTNEVTGNLAIDFGNVDYTISQGQWDGKNDALTNFKGKSYRIFSDITEQYTSLTEFLENGISSYFNHFYARVRGAKAQEWGTADGFAFIPGLNYGGFIEGVINSEFVTGSISIFRTNKKINFSLDRANHSLSLNLDGWIGTATQDILDGLLSMSIAGKGNQHVHLYSPDAFSNTLFNTTQTYGCQLEVFTTSGNQTVIGYPLNPNQHRIYVYKRNTVEATPTRYYFEGTVL